MSVLQLHCAYTHSGGEEGVVAMEAELLRLRGHEVRALRFSNPDALAQGILARTRALLSSAWNCENYRRVREVIREFCPDVVHVHNFWWAASPSVFAAAHAEGVPTVLTLHNYRLICPSALLMRDGRPCEVCVGRTPWRGVARRCYHGRASDSALVARMIDHNRLRGTWWRDVDAFIALTEFSRGRFIAGGLPAERIFVKPNPVARSQIPLNELGRGGVFVGRLSYEKGAGTLVDAWRDLDGAPLTILGSGPERKKLQVRAKSAEIEWAGHVEHGAALDRIRSAAFLIAPSLCYENFPLAIAEAFASGRPVLASRLGAMAQLVDNGRTGLFFEPGNANDLAAKARWLLDHPAECERMGREARREFETRYTAEANYPQLMTIYEKAIGHHRRQAAHRRSFTVPRGVPSSLPRPPTVGIAGSDISIVNYDSAVRYIESWAKGRESRYVCVCPATGVTTAWLRPDFKRILNEADMVTPDGFPVAATLRLLGVPVRERVYGPDLALDICQMCARRGWPVFFYGATDETLAKLRENLTVKIPGLRIAGTHAPPFRPLTEDEDHEITKRINASGAHIVFVGIGMPKQERWMHAHRGRISAVMLGVGAAFDFHAGTVPQAPPWMQRCGLEWFYRLVAEPRRLCRRYARDVPLYSALALLEIARGRRYTRRRGRRRPCVCRS